MMRILLMCTLICLSLGVLANTDYTVEQFGYTGSDPAADIQAFDDALAAARLSGGAVRLGCGTYLLENTLYLQTGDTLIGQGSEDTTIKFPVALTYHMTNGPYQAGYGNDEHIRLEGFTLETLFRENVLYFGLRLWGVDYPIMRDIQVRNVSVGHAILFRNCRYTEFGEVDKLRVENANFSIDPEYIPGQPSPSRHVIYFSGCQDMIATNLTVNDARSTAPGKDRDSIGCAGSENVVISGMRGRDINTLLDAGFNKNCVFENFSGTDIDFVPVYTNNGNQGCVFRNGKFANSDYGIVVRSAGTGINDVEAFNVYQNFDFWNIGSFGTARPGIWVSHNSPEDLTRGPHDNRFLDIQFVDTNMTPTISQVVLEEYGAIGKNTYRNCTVEAPDATVAVGDRITGPTSGPNLQGFEEKVGYRDVNFVGFPNSAWQSETFTIPNVKKIVGVTVGVSTTTLGDQVQYINVSARAVSGNTFHLVVATTDGSTLSSRVTDALRLTWRALVE